MKRLSQYLVLGAMALSTTALNAATDLTLHLTGFTRSRDRPCGSPVTRKERRWASPQRRFRWST